MKVQISNQSTSLVKKHNTSNSKTLPLVLLVFTRFTLK